MRIVNVLLVGVALFPFSGWALGGGAVEADSSRAAAANVGMVVDSKLSVLTTVMNKILTCNALRKVYAPDHASADSQGCVGVFASTGACSNGSTVKIVNGVLTCYSTYTRSASGGGNPVYAYCDVGDDAIDILDTGVGRNHSATKVRNATTGAWGCEAREGAANYGGMGCDVTCGGYR